MKNWRTSSRFSRRERRRKEAFRHCHRNNLIMRTYNPYRLRIVLLLRALPWHRRVLPSASQQQVRMKAAALRRSLPKLALLISSQFLYTFDLKLVHTKKKLSYKFNTGSGAASARLSMVHQHLSAMLLQQQRAASALSTLIPHPACADCMPPHPARQESWCAAYRCMRNSEANHWQGHFQRAALRHTSCCRLPPTVCRPTCRLRSSSARTRGCFFVFGHRGGCAGRCVERFQPTQQTAGTQEHIGSLPISSLLRYQHLSSQCSLVCWWGSNLLS